MAELENILEETIPEYNEEEESELDWETDDEEQGGGESTETATESEAKKDENATEETTEEEYYPEELTVYGEKKKIPMKDVKAFLQKGLAFDHSKQSYEEKLKRASEDPRIAFVEELAQASGVDAAQLMASMRMQTELAPLIEQYGGMEAIPEAVLNTYSKAAQADREKTQKLFDDNRAREAEEARKNEFYSFAEKYPDADLTAFSNDVLGMVNGGMPLEGAWAIEQMNSLKAENDELKQRIRIMEQDNKNRTKTTQSSVSRAAKEDELEWIYDK